MGADHPIAWCHNFEGGRSWYEGAGHVDSAYSDPLFLAHLLGGIEWTAGVVEGGGNCVTFPEVEKINADLGTGGNRQVKLSGDVAAYLDAAEAAAACGDHAGAAHVLAQGQGQGPRPAGRHPGRQDQRPRRVAARASSASETRHPLRPAAPHGRGRSCVSGRRRGTR